MGAFFAAHYLKTKIAKMVKRALKTYEVKEPRSTIDLLIVVVKIMQVTLCQLQAKQVCLRSLALLGKSTKKVVKQTHS